MNGISEEDTYELDAGGENDVFLTEGDIIAHLGEGKDFGEVIRKKVAANL